MNYYEQTTNMPNYNNKDILSKLETQFRLHFASEAQNRKLPEDEEKISSREACIAAISPLDLLALLQLGLHCPLRTVVTGVSKMGHKPTKMPKSTKTPQFLEKNVPKRMTIWPKIRKN